MNEHSTFPPQRRTTQAAEGLPRWTVAEVERIATLGVFTEFDQFELLGGEIVPMMSPAGRRHETIRIELAHIWRCWQEKLFGRPGATIQFAPRHFRKAGHSGASTRDQNL